jgi:hypothetical protein
MSGVRVADLLPDTDTGQARRFVETWHGGRDGKVIITRISSAGRHIVRSWAFEVAELLASFDGDLMPLCADEGGSWNVYLSCSTHGEDPTNGGKRRGGKQTINQVHGVWLDLDVKGEAFANAQAIEDFLGRMPVAPTLLVNSGSGGRHAYWRLADGPVSRDEGEMLNEMWWALAQDVAGDTYVDKVTTADRIMRLPGTIRWPKAGEAAAQVTLLDAAGPLVPKGQIIVSGQSAYDAVQSRRKETKARFQNYDELATVGLQDISRLAGWDLLLALAHLEDIFNETVSWDEILIPKGWTQVGTDTEGRRHWARPGQTGKSAHTDYPPSPHVMKLFSNAPETGLALLNDAEIPLTKFRVHAQLAFDGDISALTEAIIRDR